MKLKLQFIIATVIGLVIYAPVVHGQANLTFSGGNDTPLAVTLQQTISYTVTPTPCLGGPIFVFQSVGNPLAETPVSGTINYSINSGTAQPITGAGSGANFADIMSSDFYIFGSQPGLSSGNTVVLSPGTITTTNPVSTAPSSNGSSYITFIVGRNGVRCSSNGVIVGPTAASATVGGRVTEANGRGIFRARVTLIDSQGIEQYAYTNPQGYYSFPDVLGGQTYIFSVRHLRYQFAAPSLVEFVDEDNPNINFVSSGENLLRPANRFRDQ